MEKFKFSGYAPSWPGWFADLAEKGKVRINPANGKGGIYDEPDQRA